MAACLSLIPEVALLGFVHDGDEALAYLAGLGHFGDRDDFPYPDLLLLDFRMPARDGMQVLAALRHRSRRPRIIFWSNSLLHADERLALRLGADLVCRKPTGIAELVQLFARLDAKIESTPATALQKSL
jgi:two-component system response regulator